MPSFYSLQNHTGGLGKSLAGQSWMWMAARIRVNVLGSWRTGMVVIERTLSQCGWGNVELARKKVLRSFVQRETATSVKGVARRGRAWNLTSLTMAKLDMVARRLRTVSMRGLMKKISGVRSVASRAVAGAMAPRTPMQGCSGRLGGMD
jgi:hypothetical protein